MKRLAAVIALTVMGVFCLTQVGHAQAIENEFYLITPVSKDVHDPALKAFAAFVKKKYNVDLKTSAMPQGTPVTYGQIVEWKGSRKRTCSGAERERSSTCWPTRACWTK